MLNVLLADLGNIPFHPLADLFPMIEGPEFDALVEDIKTNEQQEPIALFEGQILDGRNRYRACLAAGVEPVFIEFIEEQPGGAEAFVQARNINRRHLTQSQLAIVIAALAKSYSNAVARGAAVGVSSRTMQKAAYVARSGSANVIDLVRRGEISVDKAKLVVDGKASLPQARKDGRGKKRDGKQQADALAHRAIDALHRLAADRVALARLMKSDLANALDAAIMTLHGAADELAGAGVDQGGTTVNVALANSAPDEALAGTTVMLQDHGAEPGADAPKKWRWW